MDKRLTKLSFSHKHTDGKLYFNYACRCGNMTVAAEYQILRGNIRSCGTCYDQKKYPREYNIWAAMFKRCHSPEYKYYKDYGGRGISVCQHWRQDFLNFLDDMGRCPSLLHSIERKNNNGNYEKTNCVWATQAVQAWNRRSNIFSVNDVLYKLGIRSN